MLPRNKTKLERELYRINRVIDFAEDTRIAQSFIDARLAVNSLEQFIEGLIAEEIAEQLTGLFITEQFPETKNVPTPERSSKNLV